MYTMNKYWSKVKKMRNSKKIFLTYLTQITLYDSYLGYNKNRKLLLRELETSGLIGKSLDLNIAISACVK